MVHYLKHNLDILAWNLKKKNIIFWKLFWKQNIHASIQLFDRKLNLYFVVNTTKLIGDIDSKLNFAIYPPMQKRQQNTFVKFCGISTQFYKFEDISLDLWKFWVQIVTSLKLGAMRNCWKC